MNSLSAFEGDKFPLKSFLEHVSNDVICPHSLSIAQENNTYHIGLPNKQCNIEVSKNSIKVTRLNQLSHFTGDNELTYKIDTIADAKQVTGLLSGVCKEFGCTTYKEADDTVKLLFGYLAYLSY